MLSSHNVDEKFNGRSNTRISKFGVTSKRICSGYFAQCKLVKLGWIWGCWSSFLRVSSMWMNWLMNWTWHVHFWTVRRNFARLGDVSNINRNFNQFYTLCCTGYSTLIFHLFFSKFSLNFPFLTQFHEMPSNRDLLNENRFVFLHIMNFPAFSFALPLMVYIWYRVRVKKEYHDKF